MQTVVPLSLKQPTSFVMNDKGNIPHTAYFTEVEAKTQSIYPRAKCSARARKCAPTRVLEELHLSFASFISSAHNLS
jgi:hypothetical protein